MPVGGIKPDKKKRKWKLLIIAISILIVIGLLLVFLIQVKNVKAGNIGIISTLGNPVDNSSGHEISVVKGGYVFYMPLRTEVKVYQLTVQTAAYNNIAFNTNDGVQFVMKPHISYQLDEDKVVIFYKNYNESFDQLNESYLKEIVVNAYSTVALKMDSDSLIHNIGQFETDAANLLKSKMADAGLILKNANPNLEIPLKIRELVEARNLSWHNTLLAHDQMREEYAKANVQRVKDSLINSSLTPLSIQKMFIEKWDGRLSSDVGEPKPYKDINKDGLQKEE